MNKKIIQTHINDLYAQAHGQLSLLQTKININGDYILNASDLKHALVVQIEIIKLLSLLNKKTNED